ncbi:MAG: recombinase family protein [Pseudonocardia sp.]|nr:recombinase family protein [Pseudonocardia sp.]
MPGVRFAFYGRTSTAEFQDPVTSRARQREIASALVAGHGTITVEFFDVGCSRRVAWEQRPQAAALLERAGASDRSFDAVVVGEFERAFTDRQFRQVAELLAEQGIEVWLPEAGGPVQLEDPRHSLLMQMLAAQSQREVVRSRHRTVAAMRVQAVEQGRFLGGRPPYGYRLVDAGPHPNRAHAAWGRRRKRLDPDPATARHVRWMFVERLTGRSVAGIARELNERGVPCPSTADPERNRHRSGAGWNLRSVAVILANPRYTGREVWSRHQGAGSDGQRRTNPADWAISRSKTHPALVSEPDFVAAQQVRSERRNDEGAVRRYVLGGLVMCGLCGRRMDAHWVNDRAGYRCRHGHNSARRVTPERPRNLYIREDTLIAALVRHIAVAGGEVDAAAYLRSQDMVVIHDREGWSLVTRDELQASGTPRT